MTQTRHIPVLPSKSWERSRARDGGDEYHLGDVTFVLLLYGTHLLPQKHVHLLSVAHPVAPRFVDVNPVEISVERFAISSDLVQNEVHPVLLDLRETVCPLSSCSLTRAQNFWGYLSATPNYSASLGPTPFGSLSLPRERESMCVTE